MDELRAWNLKCDPDQVGAAIYQVWYRFLVEDTVKDELGPELTEEYLEFYWIHGPVMLKLMNEGTSSLFDDTSTSQAETRQTTSCGAVSRTPSPGSASTMVQVRRIGRGDGCIR